MNDAPRCAHCRQDEATCAAQVAAYQWHAHRFSPTARERWFECELCAVYRERVRA